MRDELARTLPKLTLALDRLASQKLYLGWQGIVPLNSEQNRRSSVGTMTGARLPQSIVDLRVKHYSLLVFTKNFSAVVGVCLGIDPDLVKVVLVKGLCACPLRMEDLEVTCLPSRPTELCRSHD